MKKCEALKGGYANPDSICKTLTMATERGPAGRRKGLFSTSRVQISTGETLGIAIELRAGDFSKNGVILNSCPFCGGELRDFSKDGE